MLLEAQCGHWPRWVVVAMALSLGAAAAPFGRAVSIGGQASDLALDEPRGVLYVANFTANRIEVVSLQTAAVQSSMNVLPQPGSLALSPDGRWLVVAHFGNYAAPNAPRNALSVINLVSSTRQTFVLSSPPLGVAFGIDGLAVVITSTEFLLFDPATGGTQTLGTIADLIVNTLPKPTGSFPANIVAAAMGVSGDGRRETELTSAPSIFMEASMRKYLQTTFWARLLLVLLMFLPLVWMFLLPGTIGTTAIWFWLFALLMFLLLWGLVGLPPRSPPLPSEPIPIEAAEQPEPVRTAMDVDQAVKLSNGTSIFTGRLREASETAWARLKQYLPESTVPLMQQEKGHRTAVILMPRNVEREALERKVRPAVHWILLGLTVLTTTFAGAAHQGINLLREPERFATGLPYSLALLGILGCHELGHYFMARHHRMSVTPPYFIPVPFALGTFGAFIQMRTPAENRRALFDVAVAGPIAGLVIAIPAFYFGLRTSEVVSESVSPIVRGPLGEASILMAWMIRGSLGDAIAAGDALRLSPMAFAGWLGLLITALNLLPIGQLDGGHIARAIFGSRAGLLISWAAMTSLLLLAAFVWPGLMLWALFVFFLAGRGTPPLNDITQVNWGRRALGLAAFVLLALILIPMPEGARAAAQDMRCPYL